MKTLDISTVVADPVISEVRRAKTAVAQAYGFDVIAMVRALRKIDEEESANKAVDSTATRVTPPAEQRPRHGQPRVTLDVELSRCAEEREPAVLANPTGLPAWPRGALLERR